MRALGFDILYASPLLRILKNRSNRKDKSIVIAFHRVCPKRELLWPSLLPEDFTAIVKYIDKNYSIVSLDETLKKTQKPKAVLTFDDGFYDFMEYTLPILNQLKLPSNHNIVSDFIGEKMVFWTRSLHQFFEYIAKKNYSEIFSYGDIEVTIDSKEIASSYFKLLRELIVIAKVIRNDILNHLFERYDFSVQPEKYLSWNNIIECSSNNVTIGSHSATHDMLGTLKNENEIYAEVVASKNTIELNSGLSIHTFALPNGSENQEVLAMAKQHYKHILLADDQYHDFHNNNPLVSRINIYNDYWKESVLRLEGFHQSLKNLR
jgi:peptidoglycan/xylan/chitin deacetylase (PgdA/CDA1 family)